MNGRIFDRTYEGDIDITDNAELELNKFEPFPTNPPISKVFREIGYADELGSGMRNTNKYTKLYSGGVPKFVEENTFEIIIPIENVPELQVGGNVNSETGRVPKSAEEVPKIQNLQNWMDSSCRFIIMFWLMKR